MKTFPIIKDLATLLVNRCNAKGCDPRGESQTMLELKRISKEAIPTALEKALRYRLLNEPLEAESICRDVLAVDPDNPEALVALVLALTDQFDKGLFTGLQSAKEFIAQLRDDYEREYYTGIIHERWGKAQLVQGMPREFALSWFREAMLCYERAEALSQPDDPDATLRWNTCARILARYEHAKSAAPTVTDDVAASFGDDVPPR